MWFDSIFVIAGEQYFDLWLSDLIIPMELMIISLASRFGVYNLGIAVVGFDEPQNTQIDSCHYWSIRVFLLKILSFYSRIANLDEFDSIVNDEWMLMD